MGSIYFMGLFDLFRPDVQKLQNQRDIKGLRAALHHKDSQIRAHAAYALGELREKSASAELQNLLLTDTSDVRRESALALGNIKNAPSIPALIETFKYGYFWDPDYGVTDAHMKPIEINYGLRDTFVSIHQNAEWALLQIGAPAVPSLIQTLLDPSPYARFYACNVLGNLKEKEAINPIKALLDDKYNFVRHCAARSLSIIGDRNVLENLKAVYQKESNTKVRNEIKKAIDSLEKAV